MRKLALLFTIIILGCNGKENIEVSGVLEGKEFLIGSLVSGKIIELKYKEGEKVKEGDTIAIIDHEKLQLQLEKLKAQRKIAEIKLNKIVKGTTKDNILIALENYKMMQSNYNLAKRQLTRYKNLYEGKAISKNKFDEIKTKYEVAEANLKVAEKKYQQIKKSVQEEDLQILQNQLESILTDIKLIETNISDCFITSTINGTITELPYELGEIVHSGSTVAEVTNKKWMELYVYLNEKELYNVKLNSVAKVNIDGTDETFYGKVAYISPTAEFTPKNIQTKDERTKLVFKVKLEVKNADDKLKSGLPADVVFE